MISENSLLYNMKGEIPVDPQPIDIDKARIRRYGDDISIITFADHRSKCSTPLKFGGRRYRM